MFKMKARRMGNLFFGAGHVHLVFIELMEVDREGRLSA